MQQLGSPVSQTSPRRNFRNLLITVITVVIGYMANLVANAIYPGLFNGVVGMLLIVFSFALVFFLQYIAERSVSRWSGLLLGFVIGTLQSVDTAWLTSDIASLFLKLTMCFLCLLLLFGPPIIRLISNKNPLQPGLLRNILAASVGWFFWTATKAILIYLETTPLTPEQVQEIHNLNMALVIFLGFALTLIVPLAIAYLTGMIVAYFASEDTYDRMRYFSLILCWIGLCFSFWQLNFNNSSLTSCLQWFDAFFSLYIMIIGVRHADASYGPIARMCQAFLNFLARLFSAN